MNGLTDILFSSVNMPLTVLLIILFIYWILTMLSGLDFDLDFDVEVDMEVEVDTDIELDTTLDSGNVSFDDFANAEVKKENILPNRRKDLKWWQIILVYFNFVELPFMFTFTFWILCWWFLTVFFTNFTHSYENSFGFIIFFIAIIPSLFLTKILTSPFKGFFKNFSKKGEESLDLLGRRATLLSNLSGDKLGSVKLTIDSSPINVYAKSLNGEKINSGQEVLIIKESPDKKYYFIQSYKTN
ncbi:MAG: hypothetical protein HRT69_08050 [Flavobacteriaceae bacterium]|nr:hypothetical protein [Flavobacteriaceae bacterium]